MWTTICTTHVLLLIFSTIHIIVRTVANLVNRNSIFRFCTFWPKFHWNLFRPDPNRRSIWTIIWNPTPDFGPKTKNMPTRMVCLRDRYYCHSYYQVQGAFAHLHQNPDKDLNEAVDAATRVVYYDDPLRLTVPYNYFLERHKEPPDGFLKSAFAIGLIVLAFSLPITIGRSRPSGQTYS